MQKVKLEDLEPCKTCGWLSINGEICTIGKKPKDGKCKGYQHLDPEMLALKELGPRNFGMEGCDHEQES